MVVVHLEWKVKQTSYIFILGYVGDFGYDLTWQYSKIITLKINIVFATTQQYILYRSILQRLGHTVKLLL